MSTVTTIKRGGLTAAIDSMGAQLTSLALNGNEYLWQGDPAFWGKHAPILFPIVGSLRNNMATSAAGTCEMPPTDSRASSSTSWSRFRRTAPR